jgi:hypothetical protein
VLADRRAERWRRRARADRNAKAQAGDF